MKYIWEEHDVVRGRRVWPGHRPKNGEMIIGYQYETNEREKELKGGQSLFIVHLDDGLMIKRCDTEFEMAKYLNEAGFVPGDIDNSEFSRWPDNKRQR